MSENYLDLGRPLWEAVLYSDLVVQAAAVVVTMFVVTK
jgi:hypothetical protein